MTQVRVILVAITQPHHKKQIKQLQVSQDTITITSNRITMCILLNMMLKVKLHNSCTNLDRPWGFQNVEAPRFQDNRHMKVVSQAYALANCTPQKIFLVLISVRGWGDPKTIVWLQGLLQWKIPLTLLGIEAITFRLAVQCINQLCHCIPLLNMKYKIIIQIYQLKNKRTLSHSVQYIIQYLQWVDNTLICDKNSSIE